MTPADLDVSIFNPVHLNAAVSPGLERFAEFVAVWGIGLFPVILCVLWLSGDPKARNAAVVAALSSTLALMIAGLLSSLLYRPRPFTQGLAENVLKHVADSSFPSDHVTILAAATVALALRRHSVFAAALAVATVAVAWARVALGVHFPSDILGALVIGTAIAMLFTISVLGRFADFVEQVAELVAGPLRLDAIAAYLHPSKPKEP